MWALVGFLAGVCALMCAEMIAATELLSARSADVWLVTGV